jgi:hypothetical protein
MEAGFVVPKVLFESNVSVSERMAGGVVEEQ